MPGELHRRRPPRRPGDVRALPDVVIRKVERLVDGQQRLPAHRPGHRRAAPDRRGGRRRRGCSRWSRGRPGRRAGLATVVTTHQHWDHHRALAAVLERPAPAAPPAADDAAHSRSPPDVVLDHGDTVTGRRRELDVVHLRGHTPGSVALVLRDPATASTHVFTGDSLFPGGVGNTDKDPAAVRAAARRRRGAALRRPARRHLGLPRARQGHHARRRAPVMAEWRERGW